jgi:FMN-dependent NADH-azoreductase
LSAAVVSQLLAAHEGATLISRDLVADPVPHLDGSIAAGFRQLDGAGVDDAARAEHARSEVLVREFLASDVIVVGAPMYNFSVGTQLKAWMDRVAQPSRTFNYTAAGPVGLAVDKTVIIASTRGGMYSAGPGAAMDFHETYLKAFFGFLGVRDVRVVRAELLSKGAELRSQSLNSAFDSVPAVVANLKAA